MRERITFGTICCGCERPKRNYDLTLRELEEKIRKITEKQNYILECGLSPEVEALAIKELQAQKADLKALMHQKVECL